MTISKEAVEAAWDAWVEASFDTSLLSKDCLVSALTAALPHLAPQPTQSDEKRAPVQGYSAGIP